MRERSRSDRRAAVAATVLLATVVAAACAKKAPPPPVEVTGRVAQYRRLAIVCAPGGTADASYAPMILQQVARTAPSRLDFLERVDLLADASVDATTVPPGVRLATDASYDAIVAIVYSYDGPVVADLYMLDAHTGEQLGYYRISTDDRDIPGRLQRHGYWTPTKIKTQFYGRR
jgi:hypothetical protein